MATDGESDAYDKGVAAGEVIARLAGHDAHLGKINGNIQDMSREMHGLRVDVSSGMSAMTLQIQRLVDAAEASAREVIATAKALKEAEEARRNAEEAKAAVATSRWAPWQKAISLVGGIAGLVAVIAWIASKFP